MDFIEDFIDAEIKKTQQTRDILDKKPQRDQYESWEDYSAASKKWFKEEWSKLQFDD